MSKWRILITSIATLAVAALVTFVVMIFLYSNSDSAIFWSVIFILFFDACFGIYILNSKRPAEIKVCWLLIIVIIPLFGPLFFMMFGINQLGRKKWKEYNSQQADFLKFEDYEYSAEYSQNPENNNSCFITALSSTFRPVYKNNEFEIIKHNEELFSKSLEIIRDAKSTIHISMYLFREGIWSSVLAEELIRKSREGIKVRVLYDWVGCLFKTKNKYWKDLRANGVEVAIFNPRGLNIFKGSTNLRSHKKMIIVDNSLALVGGSNLGDEYLGISKTTSHWRDMNFIVRGQMVNTLTVIFSSDWMNFTKKTISKENKRLYKESLPSILLQTKNIAYQTTAQAMESSPSFDEKVIKSNICNLIYRAKKTIFLVSPYLCPTPDIIDALKIAARDGVEVKIIVPGKPDDKPYILALNRSNYDQFLQSGVEIYEYNGFIHSKYLIVDGERVFLGSYNLDYRSLWINFENAILVESKLFADDLLSEYFKDKKSSKLIDKDFNREYKSFKTTAIGLGLKVFYPLL